LSVAAPDTAPEDFGSGELLPERPFVIPEEGIGKEVDEILAELMEQGPESLGDQGWKALEEAESVVAEPFSIPAPEPPEARAVPEPFRLPEQKRLERKPPPEPSPPPAKEPPERRSAPEPAKLSAREESDSRRVPERPLALLEKWEAHRTDTAEVLSAAAMIHHRKGRLDQAMALYHRALEIREKELGPDDLKLATTLNNLGVLYLDCGKYAEAEDLCSRSLAIVEKEWGPDHPKTARRLSNLAGIYAALRKNEAAAELYERALTILERADNRVRTKSIVASLKKYVSLLEGADQERRARKVEARIRALLA
jgi:tetratricopeptide (TPR) repeat protein